MARSGGAAPKGSIEKATAAAPYVVSRKGGDTSIISTVPFLSPTHPQVNILFPPSGIFQFLVEKAAVAARYMR